MGTSDMGGWWLSKLPHRCAMPTWEQWLRLKSLLSLPDDMDAEVWRLNGRKGTPGEAFNEREKVGEKFAGIATPGDTDRHTVGGSRAVLVDITAPATDAAKQWQGWGTALKPAFEPIVVARKPIRGTVAANVLAHGTGALNIDGCRIEAHDSQLAEKYASVQTAGARANSVYGKDDRDRAGSAPHTAGRWPTNVVLDDAAADELDRQSGTLKPGVAIKRNKNPDAYESAAVYGKFRQLPTEDMGYGDTGGASRFFPTFRYTPKAATAERPSADGIAHPTVKPLDLMRWLVRLVTPPGGVILDPFAGSGTTGEACLREGKRCVLVEREADYLPLILRRLDRAQIGFDFE
ncbi:MAG: hypothetical protein CK431_04500 [Mycobacterium sp.]|nr:MAG: hypothetical protein CK431_04500 [Mycobacterium sp.]